YSGVAGTRLQSGSRAPHLPAGAAHGAGVSAGGPSAAATAPGASRTLLRNVHHAAQLVGHGDVRLRLPVVSHGGALTGNLAGVSQRYRAPGAKLQRLPASGLSVAHPGFDEPQPGGPHD